MSRPCIKTVYNRDGTMTKTPTGFGGSLCRTATEPYLRRQGGSTDADTAEAREPSYLETEREGGERLNA